MKRFIILALVLTFLIALPGCGADTDAVLQEDESASNRWGVTLTCENVSSAGLTLVFTQSGGEDVAELSTGSYYVLEKLEGDTWTKLEYLPLEYEVAWDSVAYLIPKEGTLTRDVTWEWLYGTLTPGEYRIGKEIMNFRGTGDYDKETVYASFVIE